MNKLYKHNILGVSVLPFQMGTINHGSIFLPGTWNTECGYNKRRFLNTVFQRFLSLYPDLLFLTCTYE